MPIIGKTRNTALLESVCVNESLACAKYTVHTYTTRLLKGSKSTFHLQPLLQVQTWSDDLLGADMQHNPFTALQVNREKKNLSSNVFDSSGAGDAQRDGWDCCIPARACEEHEITIVSSIGALTPGTWSTKQNHYFQQCNTSCAVVDLTPRKSALIAFVVSKE